MCLFRGNALPINELIGGAFGELLLIFTNMEIAKLH